MKRLVRFRLISLFAIVTIASFVFWFALPFRPNVRFSEPTSSSYIAGDNTRIPTSVVTVTNDGYFPVWYEGYDGHVRNFSWLEMPSQYTSGQEGDWRGQSTRSADWSRLGSGDSVRIEIPNSDLYREVKIGIQVQDWRGRTLAIWSDPFAYAPDDS